MMNDRKITFLLLTRFISSTSRCSATRRHLSGTSSYLLTQFLRAARGESLPGNKVPLRYFPLESCHIGHKPVLKNEHDQCLDEPQQVKELLCQTPAEFHKELCHRIRQAKKRVLLATLYIGTGTSPAAEKEREFLDALEYAASNHRLEKVKVLMDASRGRRKVRITNRASLKSGDCRDKDSICSAEAVFSRIGASRELMGDKTDEERSVYLFNVLRPPFQWLPSPLNEVAGVFHMKVRDETDSARKSQI